MADKMLAITGSTGFIGGYLLKTLPFETLALVRTPQQARPHSKDVVGALEDTPSLQRFVGAGAQTLVHLACSSNPRKLNDDMAGDIDVNLAPSVRLFELFAKARPGGHIIYISTGGAIYPKYMASPIAESVPAQPWSSYACHKFSAERYLELLAARYGVAATVLRVSNPYGEMLDIKRGHGLIGVAVSCLLRNQPLTVFDHPQNVRDYVHLSDVASAFTAAINTPPASGEFRLLNIGAGRGHTIREVIDSINHASGRKLEEIHTADTAQKPTYNVLDCAQAKATIGWQPRIALEDGIAQMLKAVG